MTMSKLTPQQAAARAGVSRGTIMNAIRSTNLGAYRDNQNRWQIAEEELSRWVTERAPAVTVKLAAADNHHSDSAVRIAVLETELKNRDQRICDLERDRDSWRMHAQELAKRKWWPWKREKL